MVTVYPAGTNNKRSPSVHCCTEGRMIAVPPSLVLLSVNAGNGTDYPLQNSQTYSALSPIRFRSYLPSMLLRIIFQPVNHPLC